MVSLILSLFFSKQTLPLTMRQWSRCDCDMKRAREKCVAKSTEGETKLQFNKKKFFEYRLLSEI